MRANQETGQKRPYVGARPFKRGEKLYGRDWETLELRDLLIARRVVLLHAPSGAGKTSLIEAGLIPSLADKRFQVLPTIRLYQQPSSTDLVTHSSYNRYRFSMVTSLDSALAASQQLSEKQLVAADLLDYLSDYCVRAVGLDGNRPASRRLLIFDQFEEILSLDPTDLEAKQQFLAELTEMLEVYGCRALFAIRDDYVGGLEPYLRYLPDRLSARFRLELLGVEAARDAVRCPAQVFGLDFEDAAVELILKDLRQVRIQAVDGVQVKLGPYVEPTYLQVVCDSLERADRPDPSRITVADVERLQRVDDPLSADYDRHVRAIARARELSQRSLRNWFERELITEHGLRNQVLSGGEAKYGLDGETIDALTDARLVRREDRGGRVWYELAHDRLIEAIRKANAAWRQAHPGPLSAAIRWEQASGLARQRLLLSGRAFRDAKAWVREHEKELTELEKEYWEASENAHKQAVTRSRLGANLAETGWGVIFAADADPNLREALAELLEHRRDQATLIDEGYYREFVGAEGYRLAEEEQPAETARDFLKRHGAGYGPANPARMPYYLLIVGDPQTIPFEFQYALDVQYAVGRLDFGNDLEAYASYARSVVLSEAGEFRLPSHAVIFGPQHQGDTATRMSRQLLAEPLARLLGDGQPGWNVQAVLGKQARKARLARLLGGPETPALLFTVGHNFLAKKGDERQADMQGALLCQDWPGPQAGGGEVLADFYFSGADVPGDAHLLGLVAFLLTGWSAGTPNEDNFAFRDLGSHDFSAPRAMVSRLPQRLLGHPRGGALAVIGHVDNLYAYSWLEEGGGSDVAAFEETLGRLMGGQTVGAAMESFNQRYSHFSSLLSEALQQVAFYNERRPGRELEQMMIKTIDARNYIVLGDPAVRLPVPPVVDEAVEVGRPTIEPVPPVAPHRKVAAVTVPRPAFAPSELLAFNGINGVTGEYLFPGLSLETLAEAMKVTATEPEQFLESRSYRSSARF